MRLSASDLLRRDAVTSPSAVPDALSLPLGRVVATEKKPNTPHEFHFWTAIDAPIGIGTIVRVEGNTPVENVIPRPGTVTLCFCCMVFLTDRVARMGRTVLRHAGGCGPECLRCTEAAAAIGAARVGGCFRYPA